jgi:hypothetical protein
MKRIALLLLLTTIVLINQTQSQTQHSLVKKWETDTLLKTPESVLFDAKGKILYVSNIDGTPDGKDGKGSIGKVGLDGKIIQVDWVKGLNAPKGMGLYKDKLYVTDLTEVVVIDITKGEIVQRIPIEGSVFLNDITIDKNGVVYVSDSRGFKVYKIEKSFVTPILQNLKGPNGLLAVADELLLADRGTLFKMVDGSNLTNLCTGMDPSTDGIEMVQKNEYLVSCWSGVIYYVYADGNKQTLLDTREQKINTADIGYDAKNRIVYVPTFYKNGIVAYELK